MVKLLEQSVICRYLKIAKLYFINNNLRGYIEKMTNKSVSAGGINKLNSLFKHMPSLKVGRLLVFLNSQSMETCSIMLYK